MIAEIEQWTKQCQRCLLRKSLTNNGDPLVNIVTTYPLELVFMDYLTLEPAKGVGNVLVITDHFTKYSLPSQQRTKKNKTAEAFYEKFITNPGRDRTLSLIRERFYWPRMIAEIEQWTKQCQRCLLRKSLTNKRAPLVNIVTTYPLELVFMDYLTLEPAKGVGNVLVITDHFTKYALAIPTKNQTAKTTAEAFYEKFITNYGIPIQIKEPHLSLK